MWLRSVIVLTRLSLDFLVRVLRYVKGAVGETDVPEVRRSGAMVPARAWAEHETDLPILSPGLHRVYFAAPSLAQRIPCVALILPLTTTYLRSPRPSLFVGLCHLEQSQALELAARLLAPAQPPLPFLLQFYQHRASRVARERRFRRANDLCPSSQVFSWFGIANFYIFFVILTTSVEDASFGLKGVKVFNMICQVRLVARQPCPSHSASDAHPHCRPL